MDDFEKGRKWGFNVGLKLGLLECIALELEMRFGQRGLHLMAKVRALGDVDELRRFARFLKSTDKLEEVRAFFK